MTTCCFCRAKENHNRSRSAVHRFKMLHHGSDWLIVGPPAVLIGWMVFWLHVISLWTFKPIQRSEPSKLGIWVRKYIIIAQWHTNHFVTKKTTLFTFRFFFHTLKRGSIHCSLVHHFPPPELDAGWLLRRSQLLTPFLFSWRRPQIYTNLSECCRYWSIKRLH